MGRPTIPAARAKPPARQGQGDQAAKRTRQADTDHLGYLRKGRRSHRRGQPPSRYQGEDSKCDYDAETCGDPEAGPPAVMIDDKGQRARRAACRYCRSTGSRSDQETKRAGDNCLRQASSGTSACRMVATPSRNCPRRKLPGPVRRGRHHCANDGSDQQAQETGRAPGNDPSPRRPNCDAANEK